MPLSNVDRQYVQSLSRSDVEATFYGLRKFIQSSYWIAKNNKYSQDVVAKIASEVRAGAIGNGRHLAQYIAASSILHCADGWSYLGKSIISLLRGDPHRSRHFGYYAELRAAMSLLASEGVGIFNKRHILINAPHSVSPLSGDYGTHQFAWDCLEFWSSQPSSGDLFSKIIKPYGRTLDDWFHPIGGGVAVASQASHWFQQWGMDLRMGLDDRNARNESSYRPDGLPRSWRIKGADALNLVRDIWMSLEPNLESPFKNIDDYVLRIAVETAFRGQNGVTPLRAPAKYQRFIEAILNSQDFPVPVRGRWMSFLTRKISSGDPSIFVLSQQSPNDPNSSHAGIIARATLLLRVASGSASELIRSAGLPANSISFWWNEFGPDRGLWEGSKPSEELVDLWADVEPLLNDIDSFQSRHQASDQTFLRLGSELAHALVGLGGTERVAVWSLSV
jgi:hypothetical protein